MRPTDDELIPKVIDLLLDAVCVVDKEDRFVFVSNACEAVFGYKAEEMTGRPMYEFIHPDDRNRTQQAAGNVISGKPHLHFRNRYVRKNGETVHIMWSARRLDDESRVGVARDVTELVRAESLQAAVYAISEAAHTDEDLPSLFRRIHHIVAALLPLGRLVVALRDETGALNFPYAVESDGEASQPDEAEVLCAAIVRGDEAAPGATHLAQTMERDATQWLGVPLHSHQGVMGALAIRNCSNGARYTERDKELLQYVSAQIATAIERKRSDLRLQHLALHDALTGLPNRSLFLDRLNSSLARAQRHRTRMALLYIDLDGFKEVNDRYGHGTGDALLRAVAQRLRDSVRDSDTVARLGGDEFVIVLDEIATPENATAIAEKMHAALRQSYNLGGRELGVCPSIGIALHPEHGDHADVLMRYADAAMYKNKGRG